MIFLKHTHRYTLAFRVVYTQHSSYKGGLSGKGHVNEKPPAPCLTGEPPGGIQQQQVYSTKVKGIGPEKTQLAELPKRSHVSRPPGGRARDRTFYPIHSKYYSVLFRTIINNFSCFLKKNIEAFFQSAMK